MKINRIHFETIDSTNSWAKREAENLCADQMNLISADEQTAGRGRFTRQWVSPKEKNIYATFCFFLPQLNEDTGQIPQVLALSALDLLRELNFQPRIKWPNDLLLSEKKVAGILAETTATSKGIAMVLGIGLNVNLSAEACAAIDRPATSLLIESGKPWEIEPLLSRLAERFLQDYQVFMASGFGPFLEKFRKEATPPNPEVTFSDATGIWQGRQVGFTESGALLLQLASGETKAFHAGEILFQ